MSERFTHKLLHPDKVSDLLALHQAKVTELLAKAKKHVEDNPALTETAKRAPLDELFVLRFLLSTKNDDVESAFQNFVEAMEWRSQRLDALEDAGNGKLKFHDIMTKYSHVALIGYLGGLHPVLVVRAGRSNTKGMFTELTMEDLIEGQLMQNERIFRMCDRKTRETGLLCKQIGVIDLEGFSLFNFDSKFSKVIGKASAFSSIYYPQLLGKTVIINMPVSFRMIYKAMSVFMPASTLEKQAVCPANTLKRPGTECPFLRKFSNGVEIMPPFLGGTGPMLPEFVLKDTK